MGLYERFEVSKHPHDQLVQVSPLISADSARRIQTEEGGSCLQTRLFVQCPHIFTYS